MPQSHQEDTMLIKDRSRPRSYRNSISCSPFQSGRALETPFSINRSSQCNSYDSHCRSCRKHRYFYTTRRCNSIRLSVYLASDIQLKFSFRVMSLTSARMASKRHPPGIYPMYSPLFRTTSHFTVSCSLTLIQPRTFDDGGGRKSTNRSVTALSKSLT